MGRYGKISWNRYKRAMAERRIYMPDLNISRINELYRKSKAEGLTEEEKKEQQLLRQQYVAAIRGSIRSQLDNIDLQMEDGTIVNLGEKFGKKQKGADA